MNQITLVLLNIVLSLVVAYIGKERKFGFWGYLFASLFLTPLVGLLLVVASDAPSKAEEVAEQ